MQKNIVSNLKVVLDWFGWIQLWLSLAPLTYVISF